METTNLLLPSTQRAAKANEWKQDVEEAVIITEQPAKRSPFIEANTTEVTLDHLKNDCIIPTFAKDNEVCISHQSFIESVYEAARDFYHGETICTPEIRTSHIVRGRIPEAINKRVDQLLESDKTMYYERMIFNIEIPSISRNVNGNRLNLCITGCKSYARDNLSGKMTAQKFNIAVGFLNLACTNYNPQIQISAESETKRSIFREKDKTKRSKKESAQHSKSRNKSFVMTSVSAL